MQKKYMDNYVLKKGTSDLDLWPGQLVTEKYVL